MTLTSGEQQSNTVQTNHAEASVTVDCPSGCKIGKSSASGTSSVTLTTDSNGKATVYVMYTGTSDKTLSLKAASGSHSAESIITAKKQEATYHTVTFNFNPDIESLVLREFPASQIQKYIIASQGITVWEPDGNETEGTTAFVDFFSYTGWTLTEVKSEFNQSTKDGRVKSVSCSTKSNEIYVGISKGVNGGSYVRCFEKDEYGSITEKGAVEPNVKLSSGSSASPSKYPSGYTSSDFKAVYKLTVNSDMSVTVTIGD